MELSRKLLEDVARLPPSKRLLALEKMGEMEWEKCAADPMYWIDPARHDGIPYVYTNDPHPMYTCRMCGDGMSYRFSQLRIHLLIRHSATLEDEVMVREQFVELPTARPFTVFPYTASLVQYWQQYPLMAVEKSRDMMATWHFVTLYTWDSLFHGGRENILQSEDAVKADELVDRAKFIWDNQPKWLKRFKVKKAKGVSKSGVLVVEGLGSKILGFPQGPSQIRQYHPSGIMIDEAAFLAQAAAAFAAVKPAIMNGGRCTLVSSANPGFFQAICRDTLNELVEA